MGGARSRVSVASAVACFVTASILAGCVSRPPADAADVGTSEAAASGSDAPASGQALANSPDVNDGTMTSGGTDPASSSQAASPTPLSSSTPSPTPAPASGSGPAGTAAPPTSTDEELFRDRCDDVGAPAYHEPLETVPFPASPQDRGRVFNVTSTSDAINGNVTSVQALLEDPGPDGVSLREALTATNIQRGVYAIHFSPDLAGRTIQVGGEELPPLVGGNVTLNGDLNADGRADIKIRGSPGVQGPYSGIHVASGENTIHALEIQDFSIGVLLSPFANVHGYYGNPSMANTPLWLVNTTFAGNEVSRVSMVGLSTGVSLLGMANPDGPEWTNNQWVSTRIVGNNIDSRDMGIGFSSSGAGDRWEHTTIAHNAVRGLVGGSGNGILLGLGFWPTSHNHRATDTLIAYNTVEGSAERGIGLAAGDVGSSSNLIDDVRIIGNHIRPAVGSPAQRFIAGIHLTPGDSATDYYDPDYRPVTYPVENVIQNVSILGNVIDAPMGTGLTLIPGALRETIAHVVVVGNTVNGPGLNGINVGGSSGASRPASDDLLSDVTIRFNSVVGINNGIEITGGYMHSAHNRLENVVVAKNEVDGGNEALGIFGGASDMPPNDKLSANNTIARLTVSCNRLAADPHDYPSTRVVGGFLNATGNRIEHLVLEDNLVRGVLDDFTVEENSGPGATGNWVQVDPAS